MRRVLITGASRGIGFALAERYAEDGWQVFATCRRPQHALELARLQYRIGPSVHVLALDVADDRSIAGLAAHMADTPIDVLVNNAGVAPVGLEDLSYEGWEMAMRVNAYATLTMTRHFLGSLLKSDRRTMIAISSEMGSIALAGAGTRYSYRASKAAANMLVKTLAADLAEYGLICAALHPGWVQTAIGSARAPLVPAESAAALVRVIDALTPEHSGGFYGPEGAMIPW
ncbi:hypothetical protein R70006_04894 [Paraburkholderia domus]|uniref:SDR family oxidoreductase n=1 Tax=Paraburkholderia domus TaxID=2793075 RepID=UPI0019141660|nr:SDR family oxidoreductase [Paraburkholderia domus]MBK5051583.1 SDR family oxidoreductase [Burkholderia sp. R-70006]CAE6791954.1 hypothetical protein R70006_04894 [Paraburkholderia domus]CAE6795937.1 hypothetical protein R75483_05116 [Paraburkholderia domus]